MIRTTLAAVAVASLPATTLAATYGLDAGHTEVRFYWDHAGVSEQSGEWGKVEGTVEFDPEDIAATSVSVTVDAASLSTGVEALDNHIKSADMFDVEKFGTITFTSTAVKQTGPQTVEVTGDLTIKGITAPLVLDVELVHLGAHSVGQYVDYYAGEWLGVKATGRLLRTTFDVGYGAPLTSDLIRLEINSEMKAQ